MTSVASTDSVASVKLTPEQIVEATTLQQLQALLKSVDPSDDVLTTKKQVLIALINHVIKQAEHAGSSLTQHSPRSPAKSISASPFPQIKKVIRQMSHLPQTTSVH